MAKNVYFATKHKLNGKYFAKVVKKPYYKENMMKPFFGTKFCYYAIMCPTGEEAERLVKSWNRKYKGEGILYVPKNKESDDETKVSPIKKVSMTQEEK